MENKKFKQKYSFLLQLVYEANRDGVINQYEKFKIKGRQTQFIKHRANYHTGCRCNGMFRTIWELKESFWIYYTDQKRVFIKWEWNSGWGREATRRTRRWARRGKLTAYILFIIFRVEKVQKVTQRTVSLASSHPVKLKCSGHLFNNVILEHHLK